jgi:hypothetical protein
MVGNPVAADHSEADEEADVGAQVVVKGIGELANAVRVGNVGRLDANDQQRQCDRIQAIAQRDNAAKLNAFALEVSGGFNARGSSSRR